MDTFSHAFYGYAATRWLGPKAGWLGALLGAAPDLLYGGAALTRRVWQHGWAGITDNPAARDDSIWLKDGPPMPAELIADYNDFYRYTHSLVIWLVIGLIWWAVQRKPPWLLAAPLLHVLMDIPSHERYLTPFLFPLSDWTIIGMSWGRPPMLIANAIGLLICFGCMYWFFWRRKARQRANGT